MMNRPNKTRAVNNRYLHRSQISNTTADVKLLRYVRGFTRSSDMRHLTCGQYRCSIERQPEMTGADMYIFVEQDIINYRTPPKRNKHDIWLFTSIEPQNFIKPKLLKSWDGMFNYSSTFIQSSAGSMYNFRAKLIKKNVLNNTDFAAKKVELKTKAKALWLVSHCTQTYRHSVLSARVAYALELLKYYPIDIYTRRSDCIRQIGNHTQLETFKNVAKLKDYTFYLAFENNLCRDYISEKFWKVLEASGPTIPVALGGLSIEEYDKVAPPNSFIHVKNFSSPKQVAQHLKLVAENPDAFNYYHQWRNEFDLSRQGDSYIILI